MAGKKDYFGIASSQFRNTAMKGEKREAQGESLYEQLEKYGTPEEKAAIRNLKASGRIGVKMESQNSGFKINPWK
jgi:hypothetical protein